LALQLDGLVEEDILGGGVDEVAVDLGSGHDNDVLGGDAHAAAYAAADGGAAAGHAQGAPHVAFGDHGLADEDGGAANDGAVGDDDRIADGCQATIETAGDLDVAAKEPDVVARLAGEGHDIGHGPDVGVESAVEVGLGGHDEKVVLGRSGDGHVGRGDDQFVRGAFPGGEGVGIGADDLERGGRRAEEGGEQQDRQR